MEVDGVGLAFCFLMKESRRDICFIPRDIGYLY